MNFKKIPQSQEEKAGSAQVRNKEGLDCGRVTEMGVKFVIK